MFKDKYKNILIAIVLCLCLYIGYLHYAKPILVSTPQNSISTPSGLIKVALQNNFHISKYQATEFSRQVNESLNKPPDNVVKTTGSEWEKMAKKVGGRADFILVTDPKNPDQKPNPPKDSTVNLNQYNLFAYPKTQVVLAYSPGNEVLASYQWKVVKAKGFTGYLGPYGRVDINGGKSTVGVMMIFTENSTGKGEQNIETGKKDSKSK